MQGTHLRRIPLHDTLITAHEGNGGNDGGARSISMDEHPHMFADHPDQVNVLTKAGSLVLGDMRLLHSAHENKKLTRRNLLLIWHSRPANTVPEFWADEGHEVPDWLQARLDSGPPVDLVMTRVQGTGVELELPDSEIWQGRGIGSLMRSPADGLLPRGAVNRNAARKAGAAQERAAKL
jgi:hypothetical protein